MILITGAGGNVGSALVTQLEHQAGDLRLAYNSPEKAAAAQKRGHNAEVFDFTEEQDLRRSLRGVRTLFLLSPSGPLQQVYETRFVRLAVELDVQRIVKLSVWDAPRQAHGIARIHRSTERLIENSPVDWTFLRPNGFMQNFVTQMRSQIESGMLYLPAGDAAVSHVDVRDVAAVAARVLCSHGHHRAAYNLSGPQALTYAQAAQIFSVTLGMPVGYTSIPDEQARQSMIERGLPSAYAEDLLDIFRDYRACGGQDVTQTVEQITGRAATPFDQFARDYKEMLFRPRVPLTHRSTDRVD